jgi:O-acetyl-ADP-ribose deacetylase (regulator of RNase III)
MDQIRQQVQRLAQQLLARCTDNRCRHGEAVLTPTGSLDAHVCDTCAAALADLSLLAYIDSVVMSTQGQQPAPTSWVESIRGK